MKLQIETVLKIFSVFMGSIFLVCMYMAFTGMIEKQPEVGQCYMWGIKDCSEPMLGWEREEGRQYVEKVEELGKQSVKAIYYVYDCNMKLIYIRENISDLKSSFMWEKKVPCPVEE